MSADFRYEFRRQGRRLKSFPRFAGPRSYAGGPIFSRHIGQPLTYASQYQPTFTGNHLYDDCREPTPNLRGRPLH
jgi:hypothetical protein